MMLEYNASNQRVRHLFGVLVSLQLAVASWLNHEQDLYKCFDTNVPTWCFRHPHSLGVIIGQAFEHLTTKQKGQTP